MDWLRQNRYTIFLITLGIFLIGIFGGLGANYFGGLSKANAVAEVNGVKIPYEQLSKLANRRINAIREKNPTQDFSESMMKQLEQETLSDLIREEVFVQEAKNYGITVTDQELAADVQRFPAFQRDGRFDVRTYIEVLRRMENSIPEEFEESRRKQILIGKLQNLIASSAWVTDQETEWEYAQRHKGKKGDFAKEKDAFRQSLSQERALWVFDQWAKQLSAQYKIRTYLERFQKTAPAS